MTAWIIAAMLYLLGGRMAFELFTLMKSANPDARQVPVVLEAVLWPLVVLIAAFADDTSFPGSGSINK